MAAAAQSEHFTGKNSRVVIAGAGISGILMGILLKKAGMNNVRILEKAPSLGGTWRDNNYPGVACDAPSHSYVYSFEMNPNYRYRYAKGREILLYYKRTADKYGVTPLITFNAEVTSADWTGSAWTIEAANGETLTAEIFVSCCGRLHHPVTPDIPGLGDFEGPCFHSARWDTKVDPAGKRVGVIGTGSSSAQMTVAMADVVEKLVVFQRTAHWVIAPANTKVPLWKSLQIKLFPSAAQAYYRKLKAESEEVARRRMSGPEGRQDRITQAHAALAQIRDPELRAKLTPDYAVGCKRMVISHGFPEAIQKPAVTLETVGIERIEAGGVRLTDGRLHELDILCLATGFKSDAYMRPMTMTGKDGMTLETLWSDGLINYRTVGLPHMPNFFMINGPFSPGGTTPIVRAAEAQAGYVMQLIGKIVAEGGALMPAEESAKRFLKEAQARGNETVWATGGCKSWYLDKNGVPIVDPLLPAELEKSLEHAHFEDFIHERAAAA